MQERGSSIANALELHLSCTNPSIWTSDDLVVCWHIYQYMLLSLDEFEHNDFVPIH